MANDDRYAKGWKDGYAASVQANLLESDRRMRAFRRLLSEEELYRDDSGEAAARAPGELPPAGAHEEFQRAILDSRLNFLAGRLRNEESARVAESKRLDRHKEAVRQSEQALLAEIDRLKDRVKVLEARL